MIETMDDRKPQLAHSLMQEMGIVPPPNTIFDFWQIVSDNMDKKWDWSMLSCISPMNWEFVDQHISKRWDTWVLSFRPDFPMWLAKKHPEKNWNVPEDWYIYNTRLEAILKSPTTKWDWDVMSSDIFYEMDTVIVPNIDLPWNFEKLQRRHDFDKSLVERYPHKPWNWRMYGQPYSEFLENNPKLEWDWEHLHKYLYYDNDVQTFIRLVPDNVLHKLTPNMRNRTLDECVEHNKPIDYEWLSQNIQYLYEGLLEKYLHDRPWNFQSISCHMKLSLNIVVENPDLEWDWDAISKHPNLTWEIVSTNSNKAWNWSTLSSRGHEIACEWKTMSKFYQIKWQISTANIYNGWNWKILSRNRMLWWRMVAAYPDKEWDQASLARHEYIHWRVITYKHMHRRIQYDIFPAHEVPKQILEKYWYLNWNNMDKIRRERAARIIQQWWLPLYYDPYTLTCQRRLLREANELMGAILA